VLTDWRSSPPAACLLIDHSGSMRGLGVALAAVAAAAVALACALTYLRVRPRTAGPLPADAALT